MEKIKSLENNEPIYKFNIVTITPEFVMAKLENGDTVYLKKPDTKYKAKGMVWYLTGLKNNKTPTLRGYVSGLYMYRDYEKTEIYSSDIKTITGERLFVWIKMDLEERTLTVFNKA